MARRTTKKRPPSKEKVDLSQALNMVNEAMLELEKLNEEIAVKTRELDELLGHISSKHESLATISEEIELAIKVKESCKVNLTGLNKSLEVIHGEKEALTESIAKQKADAKIQYTLDLEKRGGVKADLEKSIKMLGGQLDGLAELTKKLVDKNNVQIEKGDELRSKIEGERITLEILKQNAESTLEQLESNKEKIATQNSKIEGLKTGIKEFETALNVTQNTLLAEDKKLKAKKEQVEKVNKDIEKQKKVLLTLVVRESKIGKKEKAIKKAYKEVGLELKV